LRVEDVYLGKFGGRAALIAAQLAKALSRAFLSIPFAVLVGQ
jgi:hypothetical protein